MNWKERVETLKYNKHLQDKALLDAEEHIASHLFSHYKEYSPDNHVIRIIACLSKQFGEQSCGVAPSVFSEIYFELRASLDAWFAHLEGKDRPHKEECVVAGRALTMLVLSKIRPDLFEQGTLEVKTQQARTTTEAISLLREADSSIAQAQEIFAPLEKQLPETMLCPSPLSLLQAAVLKFQAARRFLEEGSGILEAYTQIDVWQLVPPVTASCYSDDRIVEVEQFDATLWFLKAEDASLLTLRVQGYQRGYMADSVAEMMADYDPRVEALFAHLDGLSPESQFKGYECVVNEGEAETWIAQHRPHLLREEKEEECIE